MLLNQILGLLKGHDLLTFCCLPASKHTGVSTFTHVCDLYVVLYFCIILVSFYLFFSSFFIYFQFSPVNSEECASNAH